MKKVPELFGSMVFNEAVMKERLPKDAYKALKQTIRQGSALDPQIAGVVANAMKDWAIEKGATPLRSMIPSSLLVRMERLSWSFPERN